MDKKLKLKTELAKKLKKETSATGTGASVTPGTGEGVATKYAFGKRDNKGTPKDWKAAPSIPNRPSKAMDYKELWEGKIHIGTDTKTDSDIFFEPETGTFYINVIDAAGNRTNKLQVNTIDDVLAKFPSWKWTEQGKATFGDTLDEATGFKSGKEFINIKLQKYPKALSKVNDLINMIGEDKFTMDMAEWIWDFFNNASFESPISEESLQEGYAQFRNETKMRSKPDQFHQAVKQVKKKMNEINRIFEYVDRLKSELSEGEDLKYKKYTENAFQQIKESAKALFLKSIKLK
jgi:hypothetical protein